MAPSSKLELVRFSAQLRIQDGAECGNYYIIEKKDQNKFNMSCANIVIIVICIDFTLSAHTDSSKIERGLKNLIILVISNFSCTDGH